jgi:hypothetical protein
LQLQLDDDLDIVSLTMKCLDEVSAVMALAFLYSCSFHWISEKLLRKILSWLEALLRQQVSETAWLTISALPCPNLKLTFSEMLNCMLKVPINS